VNEHKPYTHITASVDEGTTRLGVSFYTSEMGVLAYSSERNRPYLGFHTSEANVTISTTGAGPVTDEDVTLAREIHNAAGHYLAECERLHAAQRDNHEQTGESNA
jgi:hypothetical protein